MKIALVTDHIPSIHAHSLNIVRHAQGFLELGHEVYIFGLDRYSEIHKKKNIDIHAFYGISPEIKIIKFQDYSLGYFQDFGISGKIFRYLNNILYIMTYKYLNRYYKTLINLPILKRIKLRISIPNLIVEFCEKEKIDLIYCRRAPRVGYSTIINGIPTVIESHNYYIPFFFREVLKLSKNPSFKKLITISPPLKKLLAINKELVGKTFMLEDVVNLKQFDDVADDKKLLRKEIDVQNDKKIIMYAGTLEKNRGIDTIIKAAKILNDKSLLYYIIGGNESQIEYWKNYLKSNEIGENFYFKGFVPNKQIPTYLKSADLLIAPYSKKTITLNWMSPMKVFEYMASKTPFICSDVQRIRDVCKDNTCFYFIPDDHVDLSKTIKNVMSLPFDEIQEHIKKSYDTVKEFTYVKRCSNILQNIEK